MRQTRLNALAITAIILAASIGMARGQKPGNPQTNGINLNSSKSNSDRHQSPTPTPPPTQATTIDDVLGVANRHQSSTSSPTPARSTTKNNSKSDTWRQQSTTTAPQTQEGKKGPNAVNVKNARSKPSKGGEPHRQQSPSPTPKGGPRH